MCYVLWQMWLKNELLRGFRGNVGGTMLFQMNSIVSETYISKNSKCWGWRECYPRDLINAASYFWVLGQMEDNGESYKLPANFVSNSTNPSINISVFNLKYLGVKFTFTKRLIEWSSIPLLTVKANWTLGTKRRCTGRVTPTIDGRINY